MLAQLRDLILSPQQVESLSATHVLVTLSVAALCGLVIFLVYRYFNKGVVYSVHYNMLILMVCVVTALIIISIGSNLVLSLGMVGALSIVRFRAAVKDPLDVGFIFWGVAAGLTAGARLYLVALLGTAFIAVLYIVLTMVRIEKRSFLIIVRYAPEAEERVSALLLPLNIRLKNKTAAKGFTEVTAEIRVRRGDTSFIEPMRQEDGVEGVTLVEYTGDYA
ncbi:MAG: DUF4956 domain-containing protein [Oscillospiraceae bacterium]|jgi:hypothetical protein|nr:DUF4956 domain-containing protein [Oscillospiraceae bacterium]